ncbi:BQ5605_C022g09557 [Microbotryum silenes-dioicae]|uniref:BQ5605_C022g09557 protein n=1 Tax=Microbotryum silenes-dioicae TaxID=796604 RepID=A0A2X0PKI5_9BASI|nr:BQ5605_C022g09557 [Microbotryum silenes-dioicae]
MVPFHLLALIAVGLAIQFLSARASFDADCKTYADQKAPSLIKGLPNCTELSQGLSDWTYKQDQYDAQCLCANDQWYSHYDGCLNNVNHKLWGQDIAKDRQNRCKECFGYYRDGLRYDGTGNPHSESG